jgi:GMP synthase-like glutamine amidotransferase
MRVLAFRHVPFEDVGSIRPVLQSCDIGVECADLYLPGAATPRTADFDGLIFMGGPMSVNDDLPFLRWEMQAIREAVARRQPVLGICLGAQLIAKALGARVSANPQKEIGWFDVNFTEAARNDALFTALSSELLFHWHGETFDLPPGAALLASSERCRNQAFRVGETTWGLQFHIEVTPAMIADWCEQDANCGDVRELEAPIDPNRNAKRLEALSDTVIGRWSKVLRGGFER